MLHYSVLWDWEPPGGIEIHCMDIFLHVHWLLITDYAERQPQMSNTQIRLNFGNLNSYLFVK